MLQANRESAQRPQQKGEQDGCQILHAHDFVVGGIAEVAPEALVFARQQLFFGKGWFLASKSPFEDAVEGPDADEEEDRPADVGRNGCGVIARNLGRHCQP